MYSLIPAFYAAEQRGIDPQRLNVLEPLYEACLDRMQGFVADLAQSPEKPHPEKFSDFRKILEQVAKHPNRDYFILKSIILNNLYGVDIMAEAVEICKLRLFLKLVSQVEADPQKANYGLEPLPDIDFNIRAGNTLVGFATYAEVESAVTQEKGQLKLDLGDNMNRIAEQAEIADRAFKQFRLQQTELGGKITYEDKRQLRQRLQTLNDELNRYLAREYGVNPENSKSFETWLTSHQPFHWFVEFYGIMSQGGFEVIIGNPPYVEYKNVKDYRVIEFQTLECSDLYAYTVEQSYSLLTKNGYVGLIVPISIFGTDGFSSLQALSLEKLKYLWVSCFANRPSQLFDGAQKRLTIILGCYGTKNSQVATTSYNRWLRDEWSTLFTSRIQYAYVERRFIIFDASLEKIGKKYEVSAFKKLATRQDKLEQAIRGSKNKVYYTRKFGYFLAFLDFVPDITEIRTGKKKLPSELKTLEFSTHELSIITIAALTSSTFFWFWNVLSDCRNLNRRDILAFPFNPIILPKDVGNALLELGENYLQTLRSNSRQMVKSGLHIQTFEYAVCKPIIDEIDRVLAKHYGFTDEELDFIINYDIKYRMGRDANDGEE